MIDPGLRAAFTQPEGGQYWVDIDQEKLRKSKKKKQPFWARFKSFVTAQTPAFTPPTAEEIYGERIKLAPGTPTDLTPDVFQAIQSGREKYYQGIGRPVSKFLSTTALWSIPPGDPYYEEAQQELKDPEAAFRRLELENPEVAMLVGEMPLELLPYVGVLGGFTREGALALARQTARGAKATEEAARIGAKAYRASPLAGEAGFVKIPGEGLPKGKLAPEVVAPIETGLMEGVHPLGAGDIASGWQKTYRGRMLLKPDIVLENAKESFVYDKVVNAPSYPKLMAAYKRFKRSLYRKDDPYMLEDIKKMERQPWELLTAHGGVMNAKSGTAKTLRSLADAVFSETKLPRKPQGKFRGEDSLDWDAVKVKPAKPLPGQAAMPETQVAKQPWEMTRDEFNNEVIYQGVVAPELKSPYWTGLDRMAAHFAEQQPARMVPNKGEVRIGLKPKKEGVLKWQNENEWRATGDIPIIAKLSPSEVREGAHQALIKQALSEGKPVPAEVLKDYPDLAKAVPEAPPVAIRAPELPKPVTPLKEAAIPPPVKPKEPPLVEAKPVDQPAKPPPKGSKPPYKPPPSGDVPPEPVITPDNKIWLPEPPRITKTFIEFKRKDVAGSFKKKGQPDSALDTIEQARQLVLKARDMGGNTIAPVGSYLRQSGDVVKEFGLTPEGLATKVKVPQGRSLAINDILSNYTHYDLTPVQLEIAERYGLVYKEALKLAESYGVEIKTLGGPDEFWQYIARRVKGKKNPLTGEYDMPPPSIGGFKMGAKISAQKQRVFDEMLEGVDLGFLYENPAETMAHHIKGIYRLIGNKQAEDLIKPLTRTITKEAPLKFGEKRIFEPALTGRAAKTELANAIDNIYAIEKEVKALRMGADISGALVGQVAALDISAPLIQGLPLLGHDMKMGLAGKKSFLWAKSYGNMLKTLKNPESIGKFRAANLELYKRFIEAGGITGQSEFVAGVSTAERALGKLPKAGKALRIGYRQSWGRLGAAYSDFLEIARVKLFEQLEPVWLREGKNIYELAGTANRMLGSTSAAARGVSRNRQLAERILAFAPNYLRSSFLILGDMVGKGMKAHELQASFAAMLGIWAGFYYFTETMRGKEPKMNPWPKKYGGDGAEAYTFEIGNSRIGLGGWPYSMIKTLAEIGAIAVDEPEQLIKLDRGHPLMKFARYKRGPAISLIEELATGKNFWGKPLNSVGDYLMVLVEHITPIAGQSLLSGEKGQAERVGAEFMGMRAFPYTLKSQWEDKGYFKQFDEIPSKRVDWLVEKKDNPKLKSRVEYRRDNPDVDARLFIVGEVSSLERTKNSRKATQLAYRYIKELVKEGKINPKDIPGIEKRLKDRKEWAEKNYYIKEKDKTEVDVLIEALWKNGLLK